MRHLAAHDREERHRRGLVRQPGQHDAPARPHERQRVRDRLRRAGGLDHDVDALAPRERVGRRRPAARRPTAWVAAAPSSRARAKRRGDRLTTSTRAPRAAQHLEREQAERARRPRRPRSRPAATAAAGHRADDDGERLGHQQIVVGHAGAAPASSSARARARPRRSSRRRRCRRRSGTGRDCGCPRGRADRRRRSSWARWPRGRRRATRLTPSPTASTWPTNSWPSTSGYADRPLAAPDPVVGAAQARPWRPGPAPRRAGSGGWPLDPEIARTVEHRRLHAEKSTPVARTCSESRDERLSWLA